MIHFVVGRLSAEKTICSLKLTENNNAIRLSSEEWLDSVKRISTIDGDRAGCQGVGSFDEIIWSVTRDIISKNISVVLDMDMSSKSIRFDNIEKASKIGVPVMVHYLKHDTSDQFIDGVAVPGGFEPISKGERESYFVVDVVSCSV